MKTITKRLLELEHILAPVVDNETRWGAMAVHRDELLRRAEQRGTPAVAQLKKELDELGPLGLWRETARCQLQAYGFMQSDGESSADTMARALGIDIEELKAYIAQGRIGSALGNRFRDLELATDNA